MAIKPRSIKLGLPFGIGEVDFIADESQQRAAWKLYVELVTRIAVQPLRDKDPNTLEDDEGILREALKSLYVVFKIIRETIREAGPEIADGPQSLGPISISVLNEGLRPFLAKWHPRLTDHEAKMPEGVGTAEHERAWAYNAEMRKELRALQADMSAYADMLAEISGARYT